MSATQNAKPSPGGVASPHASRHSRLSLRARILIGLVATLTVGMGLLYVVGSRQVMDGFLQLEQADAAQDAGRAYDALNQEIAAIDTSIVSYSSWDDSYAFIVDHNEAYIDSNLGDSVFAQLRASVLAYVDASNQVVWARAADGDASTATLPDGFGSYIASGSVLLAHGDISKPVDGVLNLPGGPMLVVSRAILTSDGVGPSLGSIVVGRYLDAPAIAALGDLTHQKLSIWALHAPGAPADVAAAAKTLTEKQPTTSTPLDDTTIAAYRLVDDISGKPAFVLRSELPRDIYAQGGKTLGTFLLLLPLLGVALVIVLIVMLDRLVIRPLRRLTVTAERVGEGDVTVDVEGTARDDEMGAMARAFDGTVSYLREAAAAADRVAQGDLTERMTPRSDHDELGIALNRMVDNLQGLLAQVSETTERVKEVAAYLSASAGEVAQSTDQVAQTVAQVAGGAQEQARGVSDTAAAMAQLDDLISAVRGGAIDTAGRAESSEASLRDLTDAIESTFAAAGEVERVSASATEAAESGASAVRDTVSGMSRIDAVVREAAVAVTELGAKSDQIGAIVETIDDIAEQTNLLALNAAIEAARAGEQGKGFAVVADEVRKLAERSSRATKEIAALVAEVRTGTDQAVAAMTAGASEVERGSELAAHSGRAIEELGAAVAGTRGAAEGISRTVEAMSQAAEGVVGAIGEIARIAQENRSGAEAMTSQSLRVTDSLEAIAAVSQENSAAAEQVSSATEEMSSQARQFVEAANALVATAEELASFAAQFRLEDAASPVALDRGRASGRRAA